jgi:hypothetical protein
MLSFSAIFDLAEEAGPFPSVFRTPGRLKGRPP